MSIDIYRHLQMLMSMYRYLQRYVNMRSKPMLSGQYFHNQEQLEVAPNLTYLGRSAVPYYTTPKRRAVTYQPVFFLHV